MRKLFLFLLVLSMRIGLSAQPMGVDSMIGLPAWYGVFDSYQHCDKFLTCSDEYPDRNNFWIDYYAGRGDTTEFFVAKAYTDRRIAVAGVAVLTLNGMTDVNPGRSFTFTTAERVPEEVMIWDGGILPQGLPVVSGEWNTKTPQVNISLPQCLETMDDGQSSHFLHCKLTLVRFDRAIGVDSVFYIGGTLRNNAFRNDPYGVYGNQFVHYPTLYPYIGERFPDDCFPCVTNLGHFVGSVTSAGGWTQVGSRRTWTGPFFIILDTNHYRLTVESNDMERGTVIGGGVFNPLELATIEATPMAGNRFVRWSDGATANPRVVEMVCDSTLTAVFRDINDTTDIKNVLSHRYITVFPNPSRKEVFVNTADEGVCLLKLYDCSGRILEHRNFSTQTKLDVSTLPAGLYYISVTGGSGTHVDTFVKR